MIGLSVPVPYLHSGRILTCWKMKGGGFFLLWVADHTEARSCEQKTLEFLSSCRHSPAVALSFWICLQLPPDMYEDESSILVTFKSEGQLTESGLKELHRCSLLMFFALNNELVATMYI